MSPFIGIGPTITRRRGGGELLPPPVPTAIAVGTVIGSTGLKSWVITFDLDLGDTMPTASAFAVSGFTFVSVTKTGAKEITVLADDTAEWGESYSMTYTQPGSNQLAGVTGEKVASFTSAVTNNCPTDFYFTVDTTKAGSASDTFVLPTTGSGYNCTIYWGDGESSSHSGTPGNITHVYVSQGVKQIRIAGTFPRIYFNNTGDKLKIISVDNWGAMGCTSFESAFYGCSNLVSINGGKLESTASTSGFSYTFRGCASLTTIPVDLFKYNVNVSTHGFVYTFRGCASLTAIPVDLFRYNVNVSTNGFYGTFYGCNKLQLNRNIFYADGEQSTRFLNKSPNFQGCFVLLAAFSGTQGEAPDLWNCNFGTGTATKTDCFDGHSAASLSNYASIPAEWL